MAGFTEEEIKEKIYDIVAKEARIERDTLSLDTRLEDLNIESLDMVQILFGIEDTFDVYVPQDDDSFKLETMQDVIDGVKQLIAEKQKDGA
jgi:acyl carrier protein